MIGLDASDLVEVTGLDASDLVEVTGLDVAFVTVAELGFAVAELAL